MVNIIRWQCQTGKPGVLLSFAYYLLVLLLALCTPLTAKATDLVNGLGGVAGFGENFLDRNDDSSTGAIYISSVFPDGLDFFGTVYTSLYINNNGNVTFFNSSSEYDPFDITGETDNPLIAPFFADVDTDGGATAATPGGNSTGSNLVYWDFDTVNGIFTVTWDDVGYYSSHTDKQNAFQLRLIDQGGGDFDIEFIYEATNWTTGDASSGTNGLGGEVAHAGWSSGNGMDYYELQQSGDEAGMLSLQGLSPVVFRVRNGTVEEAGLYITTSDLSTAPVGTDYMAILQATGGTPPYTWSFAPPGENEENPSASPDVELFPDFQTMIDNLSITNATGGNGMAGPSQLDGMEAGENDGILSWTPLPALPENPDPEHPIYYIDFKVQVMDDNGETATATFRYTDPVEGSSISASVNGGGGALYWPSLLLFAVMLVIRRRIH